MSINHSEIASKFIEYLESINAKDDLPEIIDELLAQTTGQSVIVESAKSLSKETESTIKSIIEIKLGYAPEIEFYINPELIGGIRVRINDDLLDFSIQNQVEALFKNSN